MMNNGGNNGADPLADVGGFGGRGASTSLVVSGLVSLFFFPGVGVVDDQVR